MAVQLAATMDGDRNSFWWATVPVDLAPGAVLGSRGPDHSGTLSIPTASWPWRRILFIFAATIWYQAHAPIHSTKGWVSWSVHKSEFVDLPITKSGPMRFHLTTDVAPCEQNTDDSRWVVYFVSSTKILVGLGFCLVAAIVKYVSLPPATELPETTE